ncbi:xanthine dehydrogenase family protein molybdopterin-binding subunit [Proteiniborus sp. MB09-C3]|uniref:xanthine dehydrogenase family protein molybdopterin-binding subunit n=1 Tax=Proteiniborus sp. MB09-C3 TaxID=3050072 RepID=UPI00255596F9|nr:xanthine dehydrogenase family protein molybdopterin-binding subunit [Proteiniborus sp. MB09-C3]WIV12405.1 xanthine dehydrogenase family protein molybdopterin-binding subunit [Proteiniborus sp. MB09-C3]
MTILGKSILKKEAWDKVNGSAKYNVDEVVKNVLHAKMLTSIYAHAKIISIDTSKALREPGVKSIITGNDFDILFGTIINDRPPIAKDKVRYYGEPVAVVVADSEQTAQHAASMIEIEYEPLPVVNSVSEAIKEDAPLIHEYLMNYTRELPYVYPQANTNIYDIVKIRKGDMNRGWSESEVIVEGNFTIPQADHAAMEVRNVRSEILNDGTVLISTSTQAPFSVKEYISKHFKLDEGKIIVHTPLVGGAFGGKAAVQLELIAYLASRSVGGRPVKIANSREDDISSSPCKMGLEARIKIGADSSGKIKAAEMVFIVDGGAYSDISPRLAKAIAVDCSGPYNIENLSCDSKSVYTNHVYATSFRGFSHASHAFCIERMMDKLALKLGIDPLELRLRNAIFEEDHSPTQVKITKNNTGNLALCIEKLKQLINWDEGIKIDLDNGKVRTKGISCFWKTSNSPTDASSGVFLSFNYDGSINLNCGVVEIGPGTKTTLAQILAEKMKMDVDKINVVMNVNTQSSPKHWKTVASMSTYMAGKATLRAAEDLIGQLKSVAAMVLRCTPEDLEVENMRVFLKQDPTIFIAFKDIVNGYQYQNGNSIEGQILGRGSFIMSRLTHLDPETGEGKAGPSWALGAQAVELEFDKADYTYRLIKAATVIDAGRVLNPLAAKGLIMGGMNMGLGLGSREEFLYGIDGTILTTSFRTYKLMRYGENPEYLVDFVETPDISAPYGARGIAEHGIIGIPGALGNAIALAAEIDVDQIPITPEYIWKKKQGGNR